MFILFTTHTKGVKPDELIIVQWRLYQSCIFPVGEKPLSIKPHTIPTSFSLESCAILCYSGKTRGRGKEAVEQIKLFNYNEEHAACETAVVITEDCTLRVKGRSTEERFHHC